MLATLLKARNSSRGATMTSSPKRLPIMASPESKAIADIERLQIECRNIMNGVYRPSVIGFMLELATNRGRLKQLRDLVLTGWSPDDIRRVITNSVYIPTRDIRNILSGAGKWTIKRGAVHGRGSDILR